MKSAKAIAMASFVAGLGLGVGTTAITAPGDVIYLDGGTRVELSDEQAETVGSAFVSVAAWTGEREDILSCVLETKRTPDATKHSYEAWCSGQKVAKSAKDMPPGAVLVGEVEP